MPDTATTVTLDRETVVEALVSLIQLEEMLERLNAHQDTPLSDLVGSTITALYTGAFGDIEYDSDEGCNPVGSMASSKAVGASRRGRGSVTSRAEAEFDG